MDIWVLAFGPGLVESLHNISFLVFHKITRQDNREVECVGNLVLFGLFIDSLARSPSGHVHDLEIIFRIQSVESSLSDGLHDETRVY